MNLLNNINDELLQYVNETNLLTDTERKGIIERIDELDTPITIMDNMEKSFIFVHKCLMTRGKEKLFSNIKNFLKTTLANRFVHVLETFVLGILVKEFQNIDTHICNQFAGPRFSFDNYWLLISLLHDYGYVYSEHDLSKIENEIRQIGSEHHVFNKEDIKISFIKDIHKTYQESEIYNYFLYINENPVQERAEHGIVGGINGYKKLLECWEQNINENIDQIHDFTKYGFKKQVLGKNQQCVTTLYFTQYDIYTYKQICYDIMQHNLFKPGDNNTLKKYKKYNMFALSNPKIKGDVSNPMYFLLSIVDTIEFVKKFCPVELVNKRHRMRHNPSTIANRINISCENDAIIIEYTSLIEFVNSNPKKEVDIQSLFSWERGIVNLEKWIDVETKAEKGKIIISRK